MVKEDIIQALCVNNECYKVNKKMTPAGIVVHSTGANNKTLKRYCDNEGELGKNLYNNHWNQARPDGRQVCVHGFIGLDKEDNVRFAQTLPFDTACWGCGKGSKGSYNSNYIQFEICEDGLIDSEYFNRVYRKAVEVCVYLCKTYNISPDKIVCHKEAYRLGYGSNHADVEHWFPKFGETMDDFRNDVYTQLQVLGNEPLPTAPTVPTVSTSDSFRVKIIVDDLNIRSTPIYKADNSNVVGSIKDHGVYTITEVQGQWGHLKSKAGWINISSIYCKRV